jgi:hypothetical protein
LKEPFENRVLSFSNDYIPMTVDFKSTVHHTRKSQIEVIQSNGGQKMADGSDTLRSTPGSVSADTSER